METHISNHTISTLLREEEIFMDLIGLENLLIKT
jgi:hypothetical protein